MGFADETWWSRLARSARHAWSDAGPPRLATLAVAPNDPDPKALACSGLLRRRSQAPEQRWRRFVDGRPLSSLTTPFLTWCGERVAAAGATTLGLVWANAAWHVSKAVRQWLRAHNRQVQRAGGVRIVPCLVPIKRPWLNPIEPKWGHGQRRIVEPARLLTASEVEDRVCAALASPRFAHLSIPQEVA